MAHFYGYLTGGRGDVTRTGSRKSGITARLQTWTAKVRVRLYHVDGEDRYEVEIDRNGEHEMAASGTL